MTTNDSEFAAIRFDSWEGAFSCARQLENWCFRGQANTNWSLASSLERDISVDHGDSSRWEHCEIWMLRRFKGAAHHHLMHIPDDDDLIEWLSLMQHHGAPTRLLDFTYSFAVATFFAAKGAKQDFAVWGFNWSALASSASARFGLDEEVMRSGVSLHEAMHEKANLFLRREASGALVFPVDPKRQNERRAAQQGLFLFPTDPSRTFNENLTCLYPKAHISQVIEDEFVQTYDPEMHTGRQISRLKVLKYILPLSERFKTLRELDKMNVHDASLFPGLDGLAQSLTRFTIRESGFSDETEE